MRARITEIALQFDGQRFEIGDEVVGGQDVPFELLAARLQARTAELVLDEGEPAPELQGAIDAFVAATDQVGELLAALIDQALFGPAGSARAVMTAVGRVSLGGFAMSDKLAQLQARAEEDRFVLAHDPEAGGLEFAAASVADDDIGRSSSAEPFQDTPPPPGGGQVEAADPPAAPLEPAPAPAKKPSARKAGGAKAKTGEAG